MRAAMHPSEFPLLALHCWLIQALGSAAAVNCAPRLDPDDKRQIANAPATVRPGEQQLGTLVERDKLDGASGNAGDDVETSRNIEKKSTTST